MTVLTKPIVSGTVVIMSQGKMYSCLGITLPYVSRSSISGKVKIKLRELRQRRVFPLDQRKLGEETTANMVMLLTHHTCGYLQGKSSLFKVVRHFLLQCKDNVERLPQGYNSAA